MTNAETILDENTKDDIKNNEGDAKYSNRVLEVMEDMKRDIRSIKRDITVLQDGQKMLNCSEFLKSNLDRI